MGRSRYVEMRADAGNRDRQRWSTDPDTAMGPVMSAPARTLQPQPGHVVLVVESHREGVILAPLVRAILDDGRLTITLVASASAQNDCVSVFDRWNLHALRLPRAQVHSEPRQREQEQRHRLRALFRALGADAVIVHGAGMTASAATLAALDLQRRLIDLSPGHRRHAKTDLASITACTSDALVCKLRQPTDRIEAATTARLVADTLLNPPPANPVPKLN